MSILTALGSLSIERFLREYWQRRPLLVRGAFPQFSPPVGRRRLFELAASEEVESRLIARERTRWSLRHGPFARRSLPSLTQPHWTLLVQGVDLADAGAHEFLSRFRFLPDARLDDLMVSFATDGGGVPAHVDNYDVFLVQAAGQRCWRIGRQRDQELRDGVPVSVLKRFRPTAEWLLEPGDLLYLPPGVAHEGMAVGECITYSVGFRTPTWQELLDPWFARFAEHTALPGRYADPGLRPCAHPGDLPAAMVEQVHAALSRVRPTRADTERFLLEHLSEPKAHLVFGRPAPLLPRSDFLRTIRNRGIVLDHRSRLLCARSGMGCNGEYFPLPAGRQPLMRKLASRRRLEGAALSPCPAALASLLYEWFAAGWLHLG